MASLGTTSSKSAAKDLDAEVRDFVADLDGFDSAEVEQIMRTNGLALAARAV